VPAQVTMIGERCRWCAACGQMLTSKGHYRATFHSLFGDVAVKVRRLLVCPCHGPGEPQSFAALNLGGERGRARARLCDGAGVVQVRVTPKTKNPFTIKALSIFGVT
jgi:hypothetical protein